jgi:hypothetical protein
MSKLRCLSIVALFCCLALSDFGQYSGWKPLKLGNATFQYPGSWQMLKTTHGSRTLVTLTPDSMQNLSMKMVQIFNAPLIGDHDYKWFKGHFAEVVLPALGERGKILTKKEIVFHNHSCMYAEAVMYGLPVKVYGLDGLFYVNILMLTQRRYSHVADPGLERDEMAILNSLIYQQ